MKFDRAAFTRHLQNISCRGQIKEVVFRDAFAANALTPDHLMMVIAPAARSMKRALPGEIGVAELDTFMRSLSMLSNDDDVTIKVKDNRLLIDEGDGRQIKLLLAEPRTIATRIEQKTVDAALKLLGGDTVPLPPELVDDVRTTFSGLKAEEVELVVGPNGGMIRVGTEQAHAAELPVAALKHKTEYTLAFGDHLIDVLSTIQTDTAVMYLSGPPSKNGGVVVGVQDGEYHYILSPRNPVR